MPLTSQLPSIDDRTYDDIVHEIRARIPSYTPEWQPDRWDDLGESDPGIVFAELFAWLSEMLLYRLAQVPEQNYIRFLELLGIELRPAEAARAQLTFPVKATYGETHVIVPLRTQVETAEPDEDGKPIVFETERSLVALRSHLAAVQARQDDLNIVNVTLDNDTPAHGFHPFGPNVKADSALLIGFSEEWPAVQVDLTVWVAEADTGAPAITCGPAATTHASAEIVWEYYAGTGWKLLNVLGDETAAFARSGRVVLQAPTPGEMVSQTIGDVSAPHFWVRARVLRSSYAKAPRLLAIRTNTVDVRQAETIQDEVLGATDGAPQQQFTLANTPILEGSLVLEIDEGFPDKTWTARDDLLGSGPRDRHFALSRATGELLFGDGRRHGAIPVANPKMPTANVIAREYRFGGGKRGNLAAGAINTLTTTVTGIDTADVGNVVASHSGRDEQTLADAKEQAASSLKSKCRAVTAEDIEVLAVRAGQIQRAKALPLYHPDFPDTKVPGAVTVIVVPDSDDPQPMPSEGMMRTVCEYLDARRLLTTELYVAKPTYKKVEVKGKIVAALDADLAEVKKAIQQALVDYFHPLRGGEDGQGWPFGGDIYYSRVYQRVLIPGVDRIETLEIWVDDKKQKECEDVPIEGTALTYSIDHHEIEVDYDREVPA